MRWNSEVGSGLAAGVESGAEVCNDDRAGFSTFPQAPDLMAGYSSAEGGNHVMGGLLPVFYLPELGF